jgi:hypothetical protein
MGAVMEQVNEVTQEPVTLPYKPGYMAGYISLNAKYMYAETYMNHKELVQNLKAYHTANIKMIEASNNKDETGLAKYSSENILHWNKVQELLSLL